MMTVRIPLRQPIVLGPLRGEKLSLLVGREEQVQRICKYILSLSEGRFLVYGYRGVGKTSLVNCVRNEVRKEIAIHIPPRQTLDRIFLDIYLEYEHPPIPRDILRDLVEQIYTKKEVFQSRNIRQELERMYQRVQFDVLRVEKEKTKGAEIGVEPGVKGIGRVLQRQGIEGEYAEYDVSSIIADIKKVLTSTDRGVSQGIRGLIGDLKALFGLYSHSDILVRKVIVLDGLDVEAVKALSNLFVIPHVVFIVVADETIGDRRDELPDFIDEYVPCMWNASAAILRKLVHETHLQEDRNQEMTDFTKYLDFMGAGLPGHMLKEAWKYYKHPYLEFTDSDTRKIKFFAKLQRLIESNATYVWGPFAESMVAIERDRERQQVYQVLNYILKKGRFSREELLRAWA